MIGEPHDQAVGVRDLEDVRGATAARLPRTLRHRRGPASILRWVRPEPKPDLVGRPSGRLHREGSRRRATSGTRRRTSDALVHVHLGPRRRHRRRGREVRAPTISSSTSARQRRSPSADSPSSSGGSFTARTLRSRHRDDSLRVVREVRGRHATRARHHASPRAARHSNRKVDLETGLAQDDRVADRATQAYSHVELPARAVRCTSSFRSSTKRRTCRDSSTDCRAAAARSCRVRRRRRARRRREHRRDARRSRARRRTDIDLTVLTPRHEPWPRLRLRDRVRAPRPLIGPDDLVVTMEGDNTSRTELIATMLRALDEEGHDAVFASPYMYGGGILHTRDVASRSQPCREHVRQGASSESTGC